MTTAHQERLHTQNDLDGLPRDGYGRTSKTCRHQAALASAHARTLREAARSVRAGEIELGRTGGGRLLRRLEVSAETFERLAARDLMYADGLEQQT